MTNSDSKLTLKLLIDTNARRVLFAEAEKDCVDFLFHILSVPVGTVIRLLKEKGMSGCLPNLYESVENLNDTYIQSKQCKDVLLKPKSSLGISSVPFLLLNNTVPTERSFYGCSYSYSHAKVSDDPNAICPDCGRNTLSRKLTYVAPPQGVKAATKGFVKEVVTYMVMDDLVVKPMSAVSSIALLNKFDVKDVGVLEEKVVSFGMEEVLNIQYPMTTTSDTKLSMKLLIDTNAGKVLFAEAEKECVDFLFHILSLPAGTVIHLLKEKRTCGSLPNLYESVESLKDTYIQSNQCKDILLKPKYSVGISSVPFLLLNDVPTTDKTFYGCSNPNYYHNTVSDNPTALCTSCQYNMSTKLEYVDPPVASGAVAATGGFVKDMVTYMVTDDLVVKPMSTISCVALVNKFNIRDVGVLEEQVVSFGMEEALELLKASFESKTVLTSVFMSRMKAEK